MINVLDITKEYRTEGRVHRALSGVSFTLAKGEKLGAWSLTEPEAGSVTGFAGLIEPVVAGSMPPPKAVARDSSKLCRRQAGVPGSGVIVPTALREGSGCWQFAMIELRLAW